MSDLILWLLQAMAVTWLFAALVCLIPLAALWLVLGMCYAAELWRAWRES